MRIGDYKAAAALLDGIGTLPVGDGVGRGAVLYLRARCQEALANTSQAIALYTEASAIQNEVMTDDGATVADLARYRLALLNPPK